MGLTLFNRAIDLFYAKTEGLDSPSNNNGTSNQMVSKDSALEEMPGFAADVETEQTLSRLVPKGWHSDGQKAALETLRRVRIPGIYATHPEDSSHTKIVRYSNNGFNEAVVVSNGRPHGYWTVTVNKAVFGDSSKEVLDKLKYDGALSGLIR